MRKYYTRPCNFYYGNYAKKLIATKKALPLAGRLNMAFDHLEIFQRRKAISSSQLYSFREINSLNKEKRVQIQSDLKKIIHRLKNCRVLH